MITPKIVTMTGWPSLSLYVAVSAWLHGFCKVSELKVAERLPQCEVKLSSTTIWRPLYDCRMHSGGGGDGKYIGQSSNTQMAFSNIMKSSNVALWISVKAL